MMTDPIPAGLTNCPAPGDAVASGPGSVSVTVSPAQSAPDDSRETNASEPDATPQLESWREEIAARLERYRTRRKPRTPRYPSLLLPFEAPEAWSRPSPARGSTVLATAEANENHEFEVEDDVASSRAEASRLMEAQPDFDDDPASAGRKPGGIEHSGRLIEFPRSAAIPLYRPSELADSVFDRPRIVEVPESLPAPPALGGMLIDSVPAEAAEKRPRVQLPASAPIVRRGLAFMVDCLILGAAEALVAAIFVQLNPVHVALPLMEVAALVIAALLWAGYGFLFLVYTASTPGLRVARLRLTSWDGSATDRRIRRWRVLASFLSALSAGLGYLWSVLDPEGLCWHDRITHTQLRLVDNTQAAEPVEQ